MVRDEINPGDRLVWRAEGGKTAEIIVTGITERDGKEVYLIRHAADFDGEPDAVDEKILRNRCTRIEKSESEAEGGNSAGESEVEYDRPRRKAEK